jgi:hypothetical protein
MWRLVLVLVGGSLDEPWAREWKRIEPLTYSQCTEQRYSNARGGMVAICEPILPPPATGTCAAADLNGDGIVGLPDQTLFEQWWGKTCE